jgi:hypothetical protein
MPETMKFAVRVDCPYCPRAVFCDGDVALDLLGAVESHKRTQWIAAEMAPFCETAARMILLHVGRVHGTQTKDTN